MKCPNCQRENEPTDQFCISCHSPLPDDKSRWEFWGPLLLTAGIIVILSVVSAGGAASHYTSTGQYPFHLIWFVAAGLWVIAIITAIVLGLTGKSRIAKGIGVGIGIAFASLAVSCGANVTTARFI